ncbi:FtsX-like permease family protein [Mangrovivirga sp. M17]|uniref:FtsX-like permease family protein n=1 Tax=Mangrovivirga halotolerans TaxID=2993936 RepID=A0ABT3RUK6_9BACT|nr:FtsX-like permease family protein [Mangrovivirga halotolerans]MCX2745466.1 FtsX-like permease family protein [Mangrovivirga halotolerans]
MLFAIAWKNIWRNKVRSLVVIIAVMLGMWAGAFILAYIYGMIDQRLQDAIGSEVSHLQIHHPEYEKDNDPKYFITNSGEIIHDINNDPAVKDISGRVLAFGMVASPGKSFGGKFIGIDPASEDSVTQLSHNVTEGEYLSPEDKNKVIIGKKLAEKLKVKLRSKIVLTFQDIDGNIVAGAFRIIGIFQSYNSTLEESNLYVNQKDLSQLQNTNDNVHEIAILLKDADNVPLFQEKLTSKYPDLLTQGWKELAPELGFMIDSLDQYMIIFFVIILLALSFGIVNTMLMAVLERVREIGMLMAIGMNKWKLFGMISLETIFMVMIAAPLGLLFAFITIEYLGTNGLDMSGIYKEGYSAFGFKSVIYPQLETRYYFNIMILVAATAVLASIYPAITALRLDPVKAIRKI